MTRPATPAELAIYRSDGLAARLYAVIDQPVVVYQCQVNQTFATHDKIAQVTCNNPSGTLSNVLPGMTVLVGSTPGAWDKGLARVRKTWTATTAYIGETSEIEWADDLYLTVVDEFAIWPRHLRVAADGTVWMDYDVEYTNQHSVPPPVPCLGPDRVLKLTGASVSTQMNASSSWVIGSSISGYSWSVVRAPAGTSIVNANTATPTVTATAPGRILLACTVTAGNGKSSVGYRNLYVYNDANPPLEVALEDFSGSVERGGFEYSVSLPTPPGFALRDYVKVILFAEEQPQSIGPIVGAENVLAIGWLDASESRIDDKNGTAALSIKGAHYWLNKISGYPSGVENSKTTPNAWTEFQNLTVDKTLWHFLYWRTTLPLCADFYLTGDARQATALQAPTGSLWNQIKALAQETILAAPVCDSYSRLFVQVDANFLPESERASIPEVMALTKDDYSEVSVSVTQANEVSRVELSGIAVSNGVGQAIFSLSPGHVFSRFGQVIQKDRLLLSNQTQANTLAGLIFSRENKVYQFSINLVSPVRLITLAPRQYLTLTIDSTDTPAGIAYSGCVLPRELNLSHNPDSGLLSMSVTCDPEIFPAPNTNGDVPLTDSSGGVTNWNPPSFPPPPLPPPLPPLPMANQAPRYCLLLTSQGLFWTESFDQSTPMWIPLNDGFDSTDYFNGFAYLDMNQAGRYYVATSKRVFYGVAGYSAYRIADESYFTPILPNNTGFSLFDYQIWGVGCNPASNDEIMVAAGNPYVISKTMIFTGSSYGLNQKRLLSHYANAKGSLSWGRNGVLFTYPHGTGFQGTILRLSFDGLIEDYIWSYYNAGSVGIPHVRYWMTDKIITLAYGVYGTVSVTFTNDGENQTPLGIPINDYVAWDETGQNMLMTRALGGTVVPWRSTDGGATFGQITTFPDSSAGNSRIYPVGGSRYVWAARGSNAPRVWYTPDFGDTFVDKTGNLFEYVDNNVYFVEIRAIL